MPLHLILFSGTDNNFVIIFKSSSSVVGRCGELEA